MHCIHCIEKEDKYFVKKIDLDGVEFSKKKRGSIFRWRELHLKPIFLKPPSPCNIFVQSKEIHLQCKLSRFNYKMAFLLKSPSSKRSPSSEIGFYSSFEGMKRKWVVHCVKGQLFMISPGWWECWSSLESDSFIYYFDSYKICSNMEKFYCLCGRTKKKKHLHFESRLLFWKFFSEDKRGFRESSCW